MNKLAQIGIDCGLNGCIAILDNGKLKLFRMKESFKEIKELLRPYGGSPDDDRIRCSVEQLNARPIGNPFMNSRMQPMITNYNRVQDALIDCNIPFELVHPKTWIKFHKLVVNQEKGIDYSILSELEKDLRHLSTHLKIENNVKNDEVYAGDVKHILNTSGKHEARKMLCDDYLYFTKQQLKESIEQTEKEITKFKSQEKTIRKNRYKDYANKVYIKSLIGDNVERIKSLGNSLNIDLFGFFYANKAITPAELRKLFKSYNLKPLTLAECDAVLILLYQLNK